MFAELFENPGNLSTSFLCYLFAVFCYLLFCYLFCSGNLQSKHIYRMIRSLVKQERSGHMKYSKWDFPNYLGFGGLFMLSEAGTSQNTLKAVRELIVHQDDSHWSVFISKWVTVIQKMIFEHCRICGRCNK